MYAMRENHEPMGAGKGIAAKGKEDHGKKENMRRRKVNIEAKPKGTVLSVLPSSLPALKGIPSAELSDMPKALKSQAECMARAHALQQEEDARIVSLLCFLTESIADQTSRAPTEERSRKKSSSEDREREPGKCA